MSLENSLERIAVALEQLANVTDETPTPEKPAAKAKPTKAKPSKPATKAKPEPTPAAEEEKAPTEGGPTLSDVRKALGSLQKRVDAAAAKALLADVGGANTLSKLDESKYQAVIDAAAE